ncbi:hypothetical protein ACJJTC_012524 [Scirpophaga incertulas]
MQEYGGGASGKPEYRDGDTPKDRLTHQEGHQSSPHQLISASYGCTSKESPDQNIASYCRVVTGVYESSTSGQKYQNSRYNNQATPTFSSPPNSPLVGLVFDPTSSNYGTAAMSVERNANLERRSQSSWSHSNQEPIGTGAKKKIVKSQDKRSMYNADPRYHERYKDSSKKERNLNSESTSSLDFFVEGERMVSELCNIPESTSRGDGNIQNVQKHNNQEDYKKTSSAEALLNVLDKIVIHDQIPNQIVQLAIEACTDAENIAIAHHNRPCFKNIHSICAKTRSNVQKPDSAVANLHSQGIPWVIKNFIFSFVRILDGWKGVKELLSEKHDTFSRIENKYYSPNIRECFVQWQAVTKEMLTHIYKTYKCLDHGFTMEQKSFTPNYYGSGTGAPRHQNQNKFQSIKPHSSTPRPINVSPQTFNTTQPPWVQNQSQNSASYNDGTWPSRSNISYKKFPVVPPPNSHNFYPLADQNDMESFQKTQYKCDSTIRETKPRQSWTITSDFRSLDNMCHSEQRDLYNQLKHKMDAELGKAPGQPIIGNMPCDMQRREMELKAKMIPLSHVEKSLIPSMATSTEVRGCYISKNNSCGDTKEENDFFAAWGQIFQKESNEYIAHQAHNIQIPSNIVTIPNNISGPVQFIDPDNDELHEMSKVYMKPGSYKVPIKPADPVSVYIQANQDLVFDNTMTDELSRLKMKIPCSSVTLAPHPKYNVESWPCLMQKNIDDVFVDDTKLISRHGLTCIDIRTNDILSSMTSDRAWEAAKQSAPKLMDFLHEGSNKSDSARLYDALGLTADDDYSDDKKQNGLNGIPSREWHCGAVASEVITREMPNVWTSGVKNHSLLKDNNQTILTEEIVKLIESEATHSEKGYNVEAFGNKSEECKDQRCPNFDQTGNYVRSEGQKKSSGKSKVAVSGFWYHPKKKKPLQSNIVKKFESIIDNLLQMNEAEFIQQDMDIKTAPRFYEVVKYPMCIHDISTKLKNSSYTEYEQVVQDFRCIFNNVRLYLKHYPDPQMKRNINKVSSNFEKILADEFQMKPKGQNASDHIHTNKKGNKGLDDKNTENSKTVEQIKTNGHRNNSSERKK